MIRIIICIFLFTISLATVSSQEYKKIILIVADDLGARDLSCYGNNFIETPNLDAMAMQGTKLDRAYASGPICSPTRASILTGLAPARIGMTEHLRGEPPVLPSQRLIPPANVSEVPKSLPTIATMFSEQDYKTAIIGKWHLGGGEQNPDKYGYDYTYASSWPGLPPSYFYPFFNNGLFPELLEDTNEGDYLTDALGDEAVRYITDQSEDAYFLHLNFYSPHVPIMAKENLLAKYDSIRALNPDQEFPNPHYAAMVESIDQNVGKIIAKLAELGQLDETLIVFTSDHGGLNVEEVPAFALHTPPTDNGELRGGKGYLYEGGIRVPWIMNHDILSETNHPPVASADLFNIFAELIGSEERTVDGNDLSTLRQYSPENPRKLHWHFPHYSPQRGRPASTIIEGDYKLIQHYEGDFQELFFLPEGEVVNLSHLNPSKNEDLSLKLTQWLEEVGAKSIEENPNYFPVLDLVVDSFSTEENVSIPLEAYQDGDGFFSRWNKENSAPSATVQNGLNFDAEEDLKYSRQLDVPIDLLSGETYWILFSADFDNPLAGATLSLNGDSSVPIFSLSFSDAGNKIASGFKDDLKTLSSNETIDSILMRINTNTNGQGSWEIWTDGNFDTDLSIDNGEAFSVSMEERLLEKVTLDLIGTGSVQLIKVGNSPNKVLDNFELPAFESATETFNYEDGEALNGQGSSTESWAGPWRLQGLLNDNVSRIGKGSLLIENDLVTSGNKYEVEYYSPNSRVRLDRALQGPIVSDGSEYWISYISDVGDGNAPNNVSNVSLINRSKSGEEAMILSIGRLYGNRKLGLSTPADGQRVDVNKFDIGTNWIVCKIKTYEDDKADEYFMWVDPATTSEPVEGEADVKLTSFVLATSADGVRIRTEGAGGNQTPLIKSFDELKVTKAWDNIISPVDEIIPEVGTITIWPNPMNEVLQYEIVLEQPATLETRLLSIEGDTLHVFRKQYLEAGSHRHSENLSHFTDLNGYYFVHFRFNDREFVRKIVIIR